MNKETDKEEIVRLNEMLDKSLMKGKRTLILPGGTVVEADFNFNPARITKIVEGMKFGASLLEQNEEENEDEDCSD